MTLSKLKGTLKSSVVVLFLTVYGLGFFLLGKNSSLVDNIKVKGAKSQNQLDSPVDSPVPFADTQSATITASFVKLCANTVYGFEVSYPKDWFTTYNTEDQKCTYFAPYSFVVPFDTANFLVPIKIEVLNPADWLGNVRFYENPNDFQNVISAQNIEINGKSVKKIQLTATGEGQIKKGLVNTTYLIFDDKNPTVISYQQTDEKEDTQTARKVLEEVVSTIRYF